MSNVLKISEAASLGLHAMVLLAGASDRLMTTKSIASLLHVSEAHLSKVLQRLSRVGLVKSVRGPKGGFILEKPRAEIRLIDIYEAIDGPLGESSCLLPEPICGGNCILGELLEEVNRQVKSYLSEKTLDDFVAITSR